MKVMYIDYKINSTQCLDCVKAHIYTRFPHLHRIPINNFVFIKINFCSKIVNVHFRGEGRFPLASLAVLSITVSMLMIILHRSLVLWMLGRPCLCWSEAQTSLSWKRLIVPFMMHCVWSDVWWRSGKGMDTFLLLHVHEVWKLIQSSHSCRCHLESGCLTKVTSWKPILVSANCQY